MTLTPDESAGRISAVVFICPPSQHHGYQSARAKVGPPHKLIIFAHLEFKTSLHSRRKRCFVCFIGVTATGFEMGHQQNGVKRLWNLWMWF